MNKNRYDWDYKPRIARDTIELLQLLIKLVKLVIRRFKWATAVGIAFALLIFNLEKCRLLLDYIIMLFFSS